MSIDMCSRKSRVARLFSKATCTSRLRAFAFFLFPLFFLSIAHADSGWTMMTADLKQEPVSFESIDSTGIRITPVGGSAQTIGFDVFLQLDRAGASPAASAEKFTLLAFNGDRIAGEPAGYQNEQVAWKSSALGELKISLKNIRAFVRTGKQVDDLDPNRTQDVIVMNNGDTVKGIVSDIGPAKVQIRADGNDVDVPLDSIAWVLFAPAGKPQYDSSRSFRIRMIGGSAITAKQVASSGDELSLTLSDNSTRKLPIGSITGIEQLNGPVSWLSSRPPETIVQTPYFGTITWPTRMDLTVAGKPIQFGGRTFSRGIGVHSYSKIDFALDGGYEAFRTQYAIANDTKTQFADVTVRIKIDGKTVHEKEHVRADAVSPVILVDVPKDAKLLTLEVDYGDANDTQDHFNWIEPALLRQKPLPPPPPPAPTTEPERPTTQPEQPSTRPAGAEQ